MPALGDCSELGEIGEGVKAPREGFGGDTLYEKGELIYRFFLEEQQSIRDNREIAGSIISLIMFCRPGCRFYKEAFSMFLHH